MTHARDKLQPHLAAEWYTRKNKGLTPDAVRPYSHKKVWWKCKKGHVWEARIGSRSEGAGCPYCAGTRVCKDNSLGTISPAIAAEWHPKKNNKLTPQDVTPYSQKKAWWICNKGHEWETTVHSRSMGYGCPYCAGIRVCKDNSLGTINPALAAEWHPKKNKGLTPRDVTPYSNRKAWWKCKKGHEWEALINNRNRGSGCPYCSGRRATKDTSLEANNPTLAKEWHPRKNSGLILSEITQYSARKVWWKCKKGHEWEARVGDRSQGHGCPYCAGQRATKDTCLEAMNPALAKEWHPSKNGNLTPRDVKKFSRNNVWWLCNKGHTWQATVNERSRGRGCPKCARSGG